MSPQATPGPSDSKSLTPGQCKAPQKAKVNCQGPCGVKAMATNTVTPGMLGGDKCVHLPNLMSASQGQESKHRDPELGLYGRGLQDTLWTRVLAGCPSAPGGPGGQPLEAMSLVTQAMQGWPSHCSCHSSLHGQSP